MGPYRISELAARAGVPATTLRFYEKEGLLTSARTSSGYRQYSETDRERMQFIVAAKHLGLPLDQIRELLTVWDGGRCRNVRDELRPLIAAQVALAEERIRDLQVFRGRLDAALEHLGRLSASDGPCTPQCSVRPSRSATIACSLDGAAHAGRMREWRELLSCSEVRRLAGGGYAAQLPVELAEDATRLVVAEQRCCPFLSFQLTFAGSGIELTAHAPEGAEALVAALFTSDAGESCPC